jgi:hypothetical protein
MRLALGTSTPDLDTVVLTSTAICPPVEKRHHRGLSRRRHAAVQEAHHGSRQRFARAAHGRRRILRL